MNFDMSRAWSEASSRLSANFSLLAILGGVFFFVPSLIMFIALPDVMAPLMSPNADPTQIEAVFANLGASFFGIYLLILLASMVGYVAMVALLGDGRRVSVGEAIGTGFKALLPLIAITLILIGAYFVVALGVGLVFGLLIAAVGAASTGAAGVLTAVLIIGVLVGLLWLFARLSMITPVIALEHSMNPLTVLARSWRLTGPVQRPLFLFYLVLMVAYIVISLVLVMVMGLVATLLGGASVLGFLNGLVGALAAMVFSAILVAVYNQVAGTSVAQVSDTFE